MGMKCGNMTTDLGIYRDAVSTANTLIIMEKGNLIEKQQICLGANSAASRSKFLHFKSVLTILALCLCMMMGGEAWGQEELTVYEGTETNSYVPMYCGYFDDFSRSQYVIPASDLTAMDGGQISAIKYYTTGYNMPYTTVSTVDVYLMEVNYTSISAFEAKNSETIVYQGTISFASTDDGYGTTITFSTPYTYNGGNLLVGCENTTDAGYKFIYFYGQIVNGASVAGYNSSSLSNVSPTQRNFIPKTTFVYTPGVAPTCPRPTGLSVTSVTENTANLQWTLGGSETAWQYSINGGTWTTLTGVTSSGTTRYATITGLSSGTTYSVQVRADCGGDYSNNSNSVAFTTECGSVNIPFVEEFGATSPTRICWTIIDVNNDNKTWFFTAEEAEYSYSTNNVANDWLISPRIAIVSGAYLKFDYKVQSSYNAEKFSVYVMTNLSDYASATQILSTQEVTNTDYATIENISLSAYAGQQIYIGIKCESDVNQYNLYVDNFIVKVDCTAPTFEYSASSYSYTIGNTPAFPTLSNPNNLAPITYSSTDEDVATISDAGVVTAIGAGTTTIKAQFAGDITYCSATAQYNLTINCQEIAVADFHFANPTVDVLLGGTVSNVLTNNTGQAVTYSSSDEDVATVASDGTIAILSNGTTIISATVAPSGTKCGKTVSYVINVGCTTPPALEWPDDITPVYDAITGKYTVTYRQGYGIKYIALKQDGSMLPSSTTGTSTNEDVATTTNGIISVNTGHGSISGAESEVTLYVPVNGDYCSQIISIIVRVECDVPTVEYGDDWDEYIGSYTYTYSQNASSGASLVTSHILYNGTNELPAGTVMYTNNHSVVSLENGPAGSRVFTINVESEGIADVVLIIPANGETCMCSTQEFAIDVKCTDPTISASPLYAYNQNQQVGGQTEFTLPITYNGGSLPPTTTGSSTDTRIAFISGGQVYVNTGGVGSADVTLNIPAYHEYCPAVVKFTVTVKYDCSELKSILTSGSATNNNVPIYTAGANQYSYSESIYLANDLRAAGMNSGGSYIINSISYKCNMALNTNVSIYMGNTTSTSFTGTAWITGLTKVVSGKPVSFVAGGWTTIELERPYVWDGTSNLAVSVQRTSTNSTSNVKFDVVSITGRTLSLNKVESILISNKVPRSDQGTASAVSYVPKIKLCAVPQYTLTYNVGNCNDAVGDVNLPEPQYGTGRIAISTVRPNCSSGSFIGWSTSSSGYNYDDIDSFIMPGDVINLTGNTTLYAVFKVCGVMAASSIVIPDGEGSVEGGMPYYDVCYGRSVHLTASTTEPNIHSYRWRINAHNGDDPVAVETTENTYTFTPTDVNGHDVYLSVVRNDGCTSFAKARIRVSEGLEPSPSNYSIPDPICLGQTASIHVNPDGGGDAIAVSPVPFTIEAQLGKGDVTFIPDGPNCIDESYTSTVTFYDFSEDARVDAAAEAINYLRVNMEHSFIGDVQIKLTCPTGKSAIILEDRYSVASGHHDDYTYSWPYGKCIIYGYYAYKRKANGSCSPMNYASWNFIGDENNLSMALYVDNNYNLTDRPASAGVFFMDDFNVNNDVNFDYTWCDNDAYGDWYNVFIPVTYSWVLPPNSLGFGTPSLTDGDGEGICNPASNGRGTGADYCWSENTTNGYSYRTGAVYDHANHTVGTGGEAYVVVPSNVASKTNFYHPKESFRELAGCPLNGDWTLTVSDAEIYDNGWIFNWEISFSETVIPEPWGYNVELAGSSVEGLSDFVTLSGSTMPYNINVAPIEPSHVGLNQSCNLVLTDNLGCRAAPVPITYSVTEAFRASITQPGAICVGAPANLTAHVSETNAYNYEWSKGDVAVGTNSDHLTTEPILENSPYSVLVSRADGCKAIAHTDINISHPLAGSQTGDFIWTGKSTNWNADYNWFQLDADNARYNLLSAGRPEATSNVFIMDYDCVSTPATLSINGTASANDINVTGGITLNGGAYSSDVLNVSGNMKFEDYNNGTANFAPGNGTVKFVGSGDQTITKSNEIEFNNVVFN